VNSARPTEDDEACATFDILGDALDAQPLYDMLKVIVECLHCSAFVCDDFSFTIKVSVSRVGFVPRSLRTPHLLSAY